MKKSLQFFVYNDFLFKISQITNFFKIILFILKSDMSKRIVQQRILTTMPIENYNHPNAQ